MKTKIILIILIVAFTSCQSVKDGLSGRKSENSDEFLVQKKNPLVLPPDFSKLPVPKNETNEVGTVENFDIKKILKSSTSDKKIDQAEVNETLEKSIIKKIKKN